MTRFGQVVVGPPGSGKTTYCHGMQQFLSALGRDCVIVNLDPANDLVPYEAYADVRELISIEEVMEKYQLGPNGGLLYCLEYLDANVDWLLKKLDERPDTYVLFDFPGQVELFTHQTVVKSILDAIVAQDTRLAAVHLVDSHHCSDASKFISVVLVSLSTMLRLELPHVNVLSKVDIMEQYGPLPFNLDFFTEVPDLSRLLRFLEAPPGTASSTYEPDVQESDEEQQLEAPDIRPSPLRKKFLKMSQVLCEIVDEFGLVSFLPLHIEDAQSTARVLTAVDRANGYVMMQHESQRMQQLTSSNPLHVLHSADTEPLFEKTIALHEKYSGSSTS